MNAVETLIAALVDGDRADKSVRSEITIAEIVHLYSSQEVADAQSKAWN